MEVRIIFQKNRLIQLFYIFVLLKNLKQHIGIVILICLGYILLPSIGYACTIDSQKSVHSSHEQHNATKKETKDSCETKSSKKEHHDNCNDNKCDHVTCRCLSSSCSVYITFPINSDFKEYYLVAKQRFGFKESDYSCELIPLLLPPKIG